MALALLLTLTFLGAGMVKGVAGMGLPTVAMGVLGTVLPPAAAAAMLVIPSFVTNVWQMFAGPATGRVLRRLWLMLVGVVVSTVLCVRFLARFDPRWSGLALGVALIVYAAYALVSPAISVRARHEWWLSPAVGLVTGAITGLTGVFVMPAVPYIQALRLEKDEMVQALGLSFTVSTIALAAGLMAHDAFKMDQLGLSALAVLPSLAGMWLGQKIRARISPKRFRQIFLLFLLLLGSDLALRPFF